MISTSIITKLGNIKFVLGIYHNSQYLLYSKIVNTYTLGYGCGLIVAPKAFQTGSPSYN